MFNLTNKLQVKVSTITHDYNNGIFNLEFRAIPITGEIVEVDYTQWKSFITTIQKDKIYILDFIGKSISDIITKVLAENVLYQEYVLNLEIYNTAYDAFIEGINAWEIDNTLDKPIEPVKPKKTYITEFEDLFVYVNEVGII